MKCRYIRFLSPSTGKPMWGRLSDTDESVVEGLTEAPWLPASTLANEKFSFSKLKLLAPAEPTKILALAYNYRDLFADPSAKSRSDELHYSQNGFEPLIFLKGPNCLSAPNASIALPSIASEVWVEVEVTVVIGRRSKNLRSIDEAKESIFGLTIGNDMTALSILGRDWHLARSKSLDGFCPIGPELITGFDDSMRPLHTWINGRQTQSSVTSNRVMNSAEAVMFASSIMTLEPGDLVLTGTPAGARQSVVKPGDEVEMEIEGMGRLRNSIVAQDIHSGT